MTLTSAASTQPLPAYEIELIAGPRAVGAPQHPQLNYKWLGLPESPLFSSIYHAPFAATAYSPSGDSAPGVQNYFITTDTNPTAPFLGASPAGLLPDDSININKSINEERYFNLLGDDLIYSAAVSNPSLPDRTVLFRRTPGGSDSVFFDLSLNLGSLPGSSYFVDVNAALSPQIVINDNAMMAFRTQASDAARPASFARCAPGEVPEILATHFGTAPLENAVYRGLYEIAILPDDTVMFSARVFQDRVGTFDVIAVARPGQSPEVIVHDSMPDPLGADLGGFLNIGSRTMPHARPDGTAVFHGEHDQIADPFDYLWTYHHDTGLTTIPHPTGFEIDSRVLQSDTENNVYTLGTKDRDLPTQQTGLWMLGPAGALTLLAETETLVDNPALVGSGVHITTQPTEHLAVVHPGTVALLVEVDSIVAGFEKRHAIVLNDSLGRLRTVAITGEPFTLPNGVTTSMQSLELPNADGHDHGRPAPVDDQGRFVFSALLENGTSWAYFLASPTPFLCPAEFNGDAVLDRGDITSFIERFLSMHPAADMNADGIVDLGDISTYVQAFLNGC